MSKVDEFISIFEYWRKRLRLPKIPITQDNRYECHLISIFENNKPVGICYNSKKLAEWNYPLIMCGIFHELAHIKVSNFPYDTNEDKIKEEYRAERYALDMINKYYPFMLKTIVKHTKSKLNSSIWRRRYPIHYHAFTQIKEYMI